MRVSSVYNGHNILFMSHPPIEARTEARLYITLKRPRMSL